MTRQDYRLIANVLKDLPIKSDKKVIVMALSIAFKAVNLRFKTDLFVKSCNVLEPKNA